MNRTAANSQLIQKMNRLEVLNYIRKNPNVSRPVVAHATGLSTSSMTNITAYLLGKGLIEESGTEEAHRVGRKGTLLRFCAQSYGLVCIFLGVGTINISYTDLEGRIISSIRADADTLKSSKVVELVRESVNSLLTKHGRSKVLGIGIAISGLILENGRFVLSSSLRWKEFDLKALLETETGLPVFIENVSLLKAVWYFNSSNQKKDNMLLVDLENGIGATQYYHGAINRAMLGEIGHTTVEKDGTQCFCGNKGCLEAMCSEQSVLRIYESYGGGKDSDLQTVSERYLSGDEAAKHAISECAGYLGIGLANLVNLCKPASIIIHTGDFTSLPSLIDLAVEEMRHRAYPALVQDLEIKTLSISEENTISGAALNLCDRLFDITYPGNIVE
ncbi:MAG: ROK family transcriptional regulator [Lachnospiraceae bacterium]|nr:ROK family transcriptional regulator [Lachnospiraceae bacterium]